MKIDAGVGYPFARQHKHAPVRAGSSDFALALPRPAAGTGDAASDGPDFTGMTRQELFDWMNGQIRDGDMSLDEGSAFLGMTVKISAATGQPVETETDATRIDFTEKARRGIAFFLSRFDNAAAERLQHALDTMQRARGTDIRI